MKKQQNKQTKRILKNDKLKSKVSKNNLALYKETPMNVKLAVLSIITICFIFALMLILSKRIVILA